MKYILSFDQGTSSSRAVLFDKNQKITGIEQISFPQYYPYPSWVEHNPEEIWASQIECAKKLTVKYKISPNQIAGLGITNQRETVVVWDRKTGKPIYNAIVWQDKRTIELCNEIKKDSISEYIQESTGLQIDSYFSATKIKWILDNVNGAKEKARKGELLCGTIDTWLVWKLTAGELHITDYSNASRTMLYNIKSLEWDKKILSYFDIPEDMLPKVSNSSEIYGNISSEIKELAGIPISGIAGDQQASLFGQNCFLPGELKNTYGTGCFLLMNTGKEIFNSKHGLLSTIAWGINGEITYALEGSVFEAGSAINWLRDNLKIIENPEQTDEICRETGTTGGVYFLPAFSGLGAPHWAWQVKGTIFGITQQTTDKEIVRAAMESIAFSVFDVIKAMQKDSGIKLKLLKVDGGVSKNNFLMQFQSDILQTELIRYTNTETTALGAALLSGLAVCFWNLEQIHSGLQKDKEFKPSIISKQRNEILKKRNKVLKSIIKLYK